MTSPQHDDRAPDSQLWLSKMADICFQVVSLLIAMSFNLLTLLEVHLTLLRCRSDFLRRKPASGGTEIKNSVEASQNLDGLDNTRTNFSVVAQLCREESNGGRMEAEYKII